MATISAVILKDKALKDGRNKVRISIAHNGKTRFITTDIVIYRPNQFKAGRVVNRPDAAIINTKLRGLLEFYQSGLDKIPYSSCLTCSELITVMLSNTRKTHRTLDSLFNECLECSRIKENTRLLHLTAWKKVTQYIDKESLVETITPVILHKLEYNLLKTLSVSSVVQYMNVLKKVVNFAQKNKYTDALNPFALYKMPQTEVRECWLTMEEIRLIRDVQLKSKSLRFARDMFMLSYYLGGINSIDLKKMDFSVTPKTIKYERTKTENCPKLNKYVEFDIPEEAKQIIPLILGDDGKMKHGKGKSQNRFSYNVNRSLRIIAKSLGIEKRIIYYSARKSFAQHAFDLGISTSIIDFILGHSLGGGKSSLYNYIKVTPEMATKAIRQVLDELAK